MKLAAGTRLGPYEILAPLGAGGMGEVYRAKDTVLGREVAINLSLDGKRVAAVLNVDGTADAPRARGYPLTSTT